MTFDEIEILLSGLKLDAMANTLRELIISRSHIDMTPAEIIAQMCISQKQDNEARSIARLKRAAKFRFDARPEDINWDIERKLDKPKIRSLFLANWSHNKENILLSGSTGTGKSWLACAIGLALVRQGLPVKYFRVKPLLEQMRLAHLDGTISRLRRLLTKPHLLILDDFGIAPIGEPSKEDLFELLEARTDVGSTLIAGQLSPAEWHNYLSTKHLADAIMGRVVQRAHVIELKGPSRRPTL